MPPKGRKYRDDVLPRHAETPDMKDAVAELSLTASYLEEMVAIAYMHSLARLDHETRFIVMHNAGVMDMAIDIGRMVQSSLYKELDSELAADWKKLKANIKTFVEFRNRVLHGQLAVYTDRDSELPFGTRVPFSMRSMRWNATDPSTLAAQAVSSVTIHEHVALGDAAGIEVQRLGDRIRSVVESDRYYIATPVGEGATPAADGGEWLTI